MDQELKAFLEAMEGRIEGRMELRFTAIEGRIEEMEGRLKEYVDERCEMVETKLLRAFHGWARTMEIRVRSITGLDERLALAEERIAELERGKRAS